MPVEIRETPKILLATLSFSFSPAAYLQQKKASKEEREVETYH